MSEQDRKSSSADAMRARIDQVAKAYANYGTKAETPGTTHLEEPSPLEEAVEAAPPPAAVPKPAAPPRRPPNPPPSLQMPTQEMNRLISGVTGQLQEVSDMASRSFAALWERMVDAVMGLVHRIVGILMWPFLKVFAGLIFIVNLPLAFVKGVLSRFTPAREARDEEDVFGEEEADEPAAKGKGKEKAKEKVIEFSDMLMLNITFTDNHRTPLYTQQQTRGTGRLGKMEEELIMNQALDAIRECAGFTAKLPDPSEGPYAGRPISDIMENVEPDDVRRFLAFVKSYPGKYIGKTWKISETFATWLLNNAPS